MFQLATVKILKSFNPSRSPHGMSEILWVVHNGLYGKRSLCRFPRFYAEGAPRATLLLKHFLYPAVSPITDHSSFTSQVCVGHAVNLATV